jgi:phospholipase C
MATGLVSVGHIVVLMLENRSFDHMLGFLYRDTGNVSASGAPFDGLTGTETCPGADGTPVEVFPITPSTANAYFLPGADPSEGFLATNGQLFGATSPPPGAIPAMQGFVTDYAQTLQTRTQQGWYVVPGTTAAMIMGCHGRTL